MVEMPDPSINFNVDLRSAVTFRRPASENHLWAFWSEPTLCPCSGSITDSVTSTPTTNQRITEKTKNALLHFHNNCNLNQILIQFWAPITTETGCVQLEISDQPFVLTEDPDERLLKYRKHCLD
ncbi:uncharacterized protein LOC132298728 [Cornus florida]|uniref:uncharacterized protein LOC132298728 n=1 Tax=Cornus florida TaxID=4283 RepID=UPI0028985967|nr:uncharacterized protein LOC132298728 [Cornus florida]